MVPIPSGRTARRGGAEYVTSPSTGYERAPLTRKNHEALAPHLAPKPRHAVLVHSAQDPELALVVILNPSM